jgi:NAD(P)-dependent dehydrogenase (short-subunit alcohol dehydrogenase family)
MELTAGKVAVVTGAASGIGLALAERFARAGLDVVLADVEEPALQAAEQKVAGLGAKTLAVPTDVSDEAAVNALAAAAVDRFGAVLAAQRESHIVNTASVAGLIPGASPSYDATKHAVVAISEDLYRAMKMAGLPVGVSVLCPSWVRTAIHQAKRNWPQSLGEVPPPAATAEVMTPHPPPRHR